MLESCELQQAYHQADVIDHFEIRTSNENSKGLDLTDLRCLSWFWSGFVIETLIFKTWNFSDMIG